jgi:DNA-binding NarL/FixJ family response regulator
VERYLTSAERDVARLMAQGLDNRAIAARLVKSEKTVANQLTQVYQKYAEWRDCNPRDCNRTSVALELGRCFEAAERG